jgi:hypothetical protein
VDPGCGGIAASREWIDNENLMVEGTGMGQIFLFPAGQWVSNKKRPIFAIDMRGKENVLRSPARRIA